MEEIKMVNVAGKDIPEFILLENGIRFTKEWIEEQARKRCFLHETVLRKMAAEIAKSVTIRTYINGSSEDVRRESTAAEYDIIYKLAYSALLGLNHGETARQSKTAEDAIINAIEFSLIVFLPDANSYDTIYIPLRKTVENWRNHTEAELALHYGIA